MYKARKPDDGSSGGGGDGGNDGDGGSRFSNGDQVESTTDLNTRARPDTGSSVRVTVSPGTTGKITGVPPRKAATRGGRSSGDRRPGLVGGSVSHARHRRWQRLVLRRRSCGVDHESEHAAPARSRFARPQDDVSGAVGEIMNGPVRKDGYTWGRPLARRRPLGLVCRSVSEEEVVQHRSGRLYRHIPKGGRLILHAQPS